MERGQGTRRSNGASARLRFLSAAVAAIAAMGASQHVALAFAPDGSGTLTTPTGSVPNGSTGNTIVFTYTAATGGTSNGAVTIVVPSGWSAPSTTGSNAGFTTSNQGTVSVASQTITVSSLTLGSGATATITYGSKASSGPGATAPITAGAATWQAQEKSKSNGTLTNLASSPSITVLSADGSGTMTDDTPNVANGATGITITFTYTAATGGMSGGTVNILVPEGSAPSTTGTDPGYTTASQGTVSISGTLITVSNVTLAANGTFTIVYGSKASGGPGATETTLEGGWAFNTKEQSASGGTLTYIAVFPQVNVLSADGSGTLTSSTSSVANSSTGNTITFTYTPSSGGLSGGSVTLVVPSGWSAPSTNGSNAGYTTISCCFGTLSVSGQTITISNISVSGGTPITITYGSKASSGPGATAPSTAGAATWQAQEKSTSGGTFTNLASSPSINVLSSDGSGTLTSNISNVANGSTGNTIVFTYTAATGGTANGAVTIVVPTGWSAPQGTSGTAGYTTVTSCGSATIGFSSQTITVSSLALAASATCTITYGSGGGVSGGTAPATAGAATWQAQEKSSSGGTLTNLSSSPSINVLSADGAGTLTDDTPNVANGATGITITFTYTAATGGMSGGAVSILVPEGSIPSITGTDGGYTTSSQGTVSVAGNLITVSNVTLAANGTLSIVYGSKASGGPGATETTSEGAWAWNVKEESTSSGTMTYLAVFPQTNVYSADGSGTMTTTTSSVVHSSTGNTITFTYAPSSGGMGNGTVKVVVPSGWSAPSTIGTDPGYTTANTGTVSVSGQTITVSGVSLVGLNLTIVYGSTASSGPGATATSSTGNQTWQASEASSSGGTVTNLASSPVINVT